MIERYIEADSAWIIVLSSRGIKYFEEKENYQELERKENTTNSPHTTVNNIGTINTSGSNLVLGDLINSSQSIDNSILSIEKEIEDKGGEDKEALKELLAEVKLLVKSIEESKQLPIIEETSKIKKLITHLDKHGWFYAEILGLIGAATLKTMQQ